MRLAVITLAIACLPAAAAYAGTEDLKRDEVQAVREELREMKSVLFRLIQRIEQLERRLRLLDQNDPGDLPWQKEQPFFWDSRERFGRQLPSVEQEEGYRVIIGPDQE